MAIYDYAGYDLLNVYDKNENSIQAAYNLSGDVVFPNGDQDKHYLDAYDIFVPLNVSNEWDTGGEGNTAKAKTLNISDAEFLSLFYDNYLINPPDGVTVTKTSIGSDQSGNYTIYEYDFCPIEYERTILLSSGMHTYELSASFGLACFINNLYSNDNVNNKSFQYIRKYVRIKVIPIVNPWGFNESPKKYGNVNGVNPNRNFDLNNQWNDFAVYTPSQNEWNVKGEMPFSEQEVVNLAKWAMTNWDAEFWIDCHTGIGYSDSDLWVYYSSNSAILNRIIGAINNIESWFNDTYGVLCKTKRTIDNEGSIRLHWAEQCGNIPGYTQEQAPGRTTFGGATNNDSGDISNYATNISTFVQEFLLKKYAVYTVKPIANASNPSNVNIDVRDGIYSSTLVSQISPADTTQNKFRWVSSDETIVSVYGSSSKAIIVANGNGTAVITGTNMYNPNIVITCTVTVLGYDVANLINLPVAIGGIDYVDGSDTIASNRIRTDYIDIQGRTWRSALTIRNMIVNGVGNEYLIRAYDSNHNFLTTLTNWSGKKNSSWFVGNGACYDAANLPNIAYIRLVMRYSDNRDILNATGSFKIRNTTYNFST